MAVAPLFCLLWLCMAPEESSLPYSAGPVITLTSAADGGSEGLNLPKGLPLVPVAPRPTERKSSGVEWTALGRSSFRFLAVMQAFRFATEADTRAGGAGLGPGYLRSITNLHGWADGDPYYINYMGHPAQGAITGRLFSNHDPRYRKLEFGRTSDYWKGKLRATGFSWAFSEQFEIGLLSEASIGHIQDRFPQQGFVDHVITPTVGLGLSVAEDALDKYLIKRMEGRIHNRWARLVLRTGLNPTRSFGNVMDYKAPWHRETRAGILKYEGADDPPLARTPQDGPKPAIAPFEFRMASDVRQFESGPCVGGGAEAAYRVAPQWQLLLGLNGCKLLGLRTDLSGDALFYQVGSRWTPMPAAKWSPYVQLLFGGLKVTHEQLYRDRKQAVELANPNPTGDPDIAHRLHNLYTSSAERNGLAVSAGTGVDYKLNEALAIRVANLEYSRSTVAKLGGLGYAKGFEFSTGMVLRLGTW
jgi:hypothetical protein